jgi:hypothetical protein
MVSIKEQVATAQQIEPICMLHWPLAVATRTRLHPAVTPGEWSRFPIVGAILNSGDAKRSYFASVRRLVHDTDADGVIFGTDVWGGVRTEKDRTWAACYIARRFCCKVVYK